MAPLGPLSCLAHGYLYQIFLWRKKKSAFGRFCVFIVDDQIVNLEMDCRTAWLGESTPVHRAYTKGALFHERIVGFQVNFVLLGESSKSGEGLLLTSSSKQKFFFRTPQIIVHREPL